MNFSHAQGIALCLWVQVAAGDSAAYTGGGGLRLGFCEGKFR